MTTLTGIVASVVVHSSAAAFSHFGLTLPQPQIEPAAAPQKVVARSHAASPQTLADCRDRPVRPHLHRT